MREILPGLQGSRLTVAWLLVLAALCLTSSAQGQGCTMCYTAAAQQSAQGKHALDVGILVLLTPALGIFCGVFFFVWRSKEGPANREADFAWMAPDSPQPKTLALDGDSDKDWECAGDNEEALPSWPNEKS